jgi:2-dehydropantoate 2-reductase
MAERVLVIGAGVNGSAIAAELFRGGVDVRILARGKRYEELCNEGIMIENPFNHKRVITRVPVIDQLTPQDIYDFVLVVVRKNQALSLLPMLAANHSPNIVFMGNNLLGPEEFSKALGKPRVMMGGVYAAGKREGSLIKAMVIKSAASPMGEVDGKITDRLKRLKDILGQGGFKVSLSENIVDYQMNHGVGVAIIASLVLKHGGKVKALAKAKDDLKLYVDARREGLQLVRALGHQIVPRSEATLVNLPDFVEVTATKLVLNSRFGEVGLEYHISQAPDEIRQMIDELWALIDRAKIQAPAICKALGERQVTHGIDG